MGSKVAHIFLWVLALSLLGFTAFRTYHFLSMTFPPDQNYMAYLGLAAFDGGVLLWFFFATKAATGPWQCGISYTMIFVDLAGVVVCTVADMLLTSQSNGLVMTIPPDVAISALYGVILIIIVNILATIVTHLMNPAHLQHMAEERARARIQARVLENIEKRADDIADDVANQLGEHWQDDAYRLFALPAAAGKKKGVGVDERLTSKS